MKKHLTLPNQITLLRILFIPIIAAVLVIKFKNHIDITVFLYVVAILTDSLDGQIARRRNLVSKLGKFLDPLADKLLLITILVILVLKNVLPLWVVVVIAARELIITVLRTRVATKSEDIGASIWGKSKAFAQNIMVILLILQLQFSGLRSVNGYIIALVVVVTVFSGLEYFWRFRKSII